MFSGYSEMMAYARNKEKVNHADVYLDADDDCVSEAVSQNEWNCMLFSKGHNPFSDDDSDFIVLAECNELYGPTPVITIPSSVLEKKEDNIDINSLVVSLLSVDYQLVGASNTFPKLDSQVLLPNVKEGVHVLANYSVLLDAKARGFIRPMCIAYVTTDKSKLIKNAPYIRTALIEACLALKHYNIKYFIQDIKELLNNIKCNAKCRNSYTDSNGTNIQGYSIPLSVNKDEDDDLLQSVERYQKVIQETLNKYELTLKATLKEIEKTLKTIIPAETQHNKMIKRFADELIKHLTSLTKKDVGCNLYQFLESVHKRQPCQGGKEFQVSLHRDYDKHLLPVQDICRKGFLLCVYWLHATYKFFKRKSENLSERPLQDSSESLLKYGACPLPLWPSRKYIVNNKEDNHLINVTRMCQTVCRKICVCSEISVPKFVPSDDNSEIHWDIGPEFINLFSQIEMRPENDRKLGCYFGGCISHPNFYAHMEEDYNSESKHGVSQYIIRDKSRGQKYDCERHGLNLDQVWDTFDVFISNGSEKILLNVLRRVLSIKNLLFALLTRRPLVIAGPPLHRKEIKTTVKLLSFFAPRRLGELFHYEEDRSEPLESETISNTYLIGLIGEEKNLIPASLNKKIAVLNVPTGNFIGPPYTGSLLKKCDQRLRMIDDGEALLAVITSILTDIEYIAEGYKTVSATARKSDSKSFCKEKELSACDMVILKHFAKLMNNNK